MATALNKEELNKYLQTVIGLESSIIEQNMIITNYDQYCEKRKPQLKEKAKIAYPPIDSKVSENGRVAGGFFAFGTILFFIMLLCGAGASSLGIFISLIFGGIMFIPGIFFMISSKSGETRWDRENQIITERNKEIEKTNEEYRRDYDNSMNKWYSTKNEVLQWMNNPLSETKSTLEKLYSLDTIYPKYRNLPALTCIYEYIQSGRCEELSGVHGAYNLYEDELRKNTIISQLNTIIENLEQIKQNQYLLYQEIHQILINTQCISAKIEQINYTTTAILGLTELSTYYNGITAANTSALAFYDTMR